MPEHLEDDDLQRFVSGMLDARTLLAVDDHLAGCSACRARLSPTFARSATLTRHLSRPVAEEHLQYEQFEAYVDGTLGDVEREIYATHLEDCAACAEDLRDLTKAATPAVLIAPARANIDWQRALQIAASVVIVGSIATVVWRMQRHAPLAKDVPVTSSAAATPQAPPLSVALADDHTVVGLVATGDASLPAAWPAEYRAHIQAALASGRLSGPAAPSFNGTGHLMGAPVTARRFAVLSPVATTVEADRPTFTWEAVPGARYRVSVFDERFALVARSPALTVRSWRPSTPLRRGARYQWQVTAETGGTIVRAPVPPAPEAAFVVLDEKTAASLANARRDHPDAHLLLGVMLYQAGLSGEATAEFDALVRANPASPLAKQFREQAAASRPSERE